MNQTMDLGFPRYRCHKIVRAAKIAEVETDNNTIVTPADGNLPSFMTPPRWVECFKPKDNDLGYYVIDEDGCESWSPTDAFESGYTKIEK
jgi:hypothetical protein